MITRPNFFNALYHAISLIVQLFPVSNYPLTYFTVLKKAPFRRIPILFKIPIQISNFSF